jgi:hypothetical protein
MSKAVLASGMLALMRVAFAAGTVLMRTRIVSVLDAEVILAAQVSEELVGEDRLLAVSVVIQMVSAVEVHVVEVAARDDAS